MIAIIAYAVLVYAVLVLALSSSGPVSQSA
jgi:hypothetical protein